MYKKKMKYCEKYTDMTLKFFEYFFILMWYIGYKRSTYGKVFFKETKEGEYV